MAIAEHGAPTEGEISLLLNARAQCGHVDIDGHSHEAEARVAARRLVMRGLGDMFVSDRGESFRSNAKGVRFISDYLDAKAKEMAATQ